MVMKNIRIKKEVIAHEENIKNYEGSFTKMRWLLNEEEAG